MVGIAQMSLYDFAIRMIKITVVLSVFNGWGDIGAVSSGGQLSFSGTVYAFFHDGMNEIICDITAVTVKNFGVSGDFCTVDANGNINPFGGLECADYPGAFRPDLSHPLGNRNHVTLRPDVCRDLRACHLVFCKRFCLPPSGCT